jgi:hypothetical protein
MATGRDRRPDLASALWPHLSRAAKAQEAAQARAQAEQKARIKRTAGNLQEVLDSLQREKAKR